MDFYGAVVTNETQFAEFVHELTHVRACCADHIHQHFLTELSHDRFWPAFFAEICKEKQQPGEAFFT